MHKLSDLGLQCQNTLFLQAQESAMSDSDDVDPIDEKLSEIHYTMLSIYRRCKRIGKKIDYNRRESEKVLCGMDQETLDKIGGCLKGVADSIPKLTSDDPHVFVSGCVDLAGAVAMLVPVYGPLLSGLLAIVSGVIIVSGEKTDILTVFKELIEKVLSKYRDEDIKAEAAGTKTELMTIQSYLSAFLRKGTHTKEDVTSLTSLQIPTVGTKFLGKLEYYINLYSKNKTSEDDEAIVFQARCAVDYIDIYLRLSALRQLLLLQYYCSLQNESVKQDFEATAEAVIRTLDIAMRKVRNIIIKKMSLVTRKTVFGVSDQVRYKPAYTVTEKGWKLEISNLGRRGMILI